MMRARLRLLYLPNEGTEGDQVGPRRAFERFLTDGRLSAYQPYSFLVRAKALGDHEVALRELLQTAAAFAPDVIFVQHINNNYPMDVAYLRKLKSMQSRPRLVLWEGDSYGRFIKRPDATLRNVMAEADITFLVGLGYLADMARSAGAAKVRLAVHSFDSVRFGDTYQRSRVRKFDAVMIANLHSIKRIPGLYLPGGFSRKKLARDFWKSFGERFAVFGGGLGWSGKPYAKGPIPFDRQGEVARSAWMTVAWDHFPGLSMYTSDRLAISLASGVPHVTNYQSGYEYIFGNAPGLYWFSSSKEAVDIALHILSMTVDQRIELGFNASQFAHRYLHAEKVYGDMLQVVEDQFFSDIATS